MTNPDREVRFFCDAEPLEVRGDAESGDAIGVFGLAAVFNERTMIGDYFAEMIMPGAFDATLERGDDVTFLINHRDLPLARTSSGFLSLSVDQVGLRMSADLDASDPDVQRIVPKMKRRDLTKMSFAFWARREEWDETGDIPVRKLLEVDLFDVSIVTDPAYQATNIGLRAAQDVLAARTANRTETIMRMMRARL